MVSGRVPGDYRTSEACCQSAVPDKPARSNGSPTTNHGIELPPNPCVASSIRGHCSRHNQYFPKSRLRGVPMFAVRITRVFGLALALCFLSGMLASTSSAQKDKDAKKAKSKLKITVPQD